MFCIHCGTELPDGARFCYQCGREAVAAPEPEPVKTPEPAEAPDPVPVEEPKELPAEAPSVPVTKPRLWKKLLFCVAGIAAAALLALLLIKAIDSYRFNRIVGQIPDPEIYFGLEGTWRPLTDGNLKDITLRSPRLTLEAVDSYKDLLCSEKYGFSLAKEESTASRYEYALIYNNRQALYQPPRWSRMPTWDEEIWLIYESGSLNMYIFSCSNFEVVSAEQTDLSALSATQTEEPAQTEPSRENPVFNGVGGDTQTAEPEPEPEPTPTPAPAPQPVKPTAPDPRTYFSTLSIINATDPQKMEGENASSMMFIFDGDTESAIDGYLALLQKAPYNLVQHPLTADSDISTDDMTMIEYGFLRSGKDLSSGEWDVVVLKTVAKDKSYSSIYFAWKDECTLVDNGERAGKKAESAPAPTPTPAPAPTPKPAADPAVLPSFLKTGPDYAVSNSTTERLKVYTKEDMDISAVETYLQQLKDMGYTLVYTEYDSFKGEFRRWEFAHSDLDVDPITANGAHVVVKSNTYTTWSDQTLDIEFASGITMAGEDSSSSSSSSSGSGWVDCPSCSGGNCTACNGSKGKYSYSPGLPREWEECWKCHGDGRCDKCDGFGKILG